MYVCTATAMSSKHNRSLTLEFQAHCSRSTGSRVDQGAGEEKGQGEVKTIAIIAKCNARHNKVGVGLGKKSLQWPLLKLVTHSRTQ